VEVLEVYCVIVVEILVKFNGYWVSRDEKYKMEGTRKRIYEPEDP
jgi:hypothetical protein